MDRPSHQRNQESETFSKVFSFHSGKMLFNEQIQKLLDSTLQKNGSKFTRQTIASIRINELTEQQNSLSLHTSFPMEQLLEEEYSSEQR